MNYQAITSQYYSNWLGQEDVLNKTSSGVHFVFSPERDEVQPGYGNPFPIFVYMTKTTVVVSYGKQTEEKIDALQQEIGKNSSVQLVADAIYRVFGKQPEHHIKFVYTGNEKQPSKASTLNQGDYESYLAFFKSVNPNCKNVDWVEEYFLDMVKENLCCGVFEENRLVSCTDAPTMPYMADKVQEIGIKTLEQYRGHGYAADCVALCIQNILKYHKCPQWSCAAENTASIHLARKVGFEKIADVLTLTL